VPECPDRDGSFAASMRAIMRSAMASASASSPAFPVVFRATPHSPFAPSVDAGTSPHVSSHRVNAARLTIHRLPTAEALPLLMDKAPCLDSRLLQLRN
jgi:hypothetical protein